MKKTSLTLLLTDSAAVARLLLLYFLVAPCLAGMAQSAFDFISRNRHFSASNYSIYPDSALLPMTPAPDGKKPFYLSHYGRHGSRYLNNRKAYDIPYRMLEHADSLGKLTDVGRTALAELRDIIADAEGRWGDLTDIGKSQHRRIAARMMQHFPEVFEGDAFVDARSTTVKRCILSMCSALLELTSRNTRLKVSMNSSLRDMWYLNHQDKLLRDSMMTHRAKCAFDAFCDTRKHNPRLMQLLFNDTAYVSREVDEPWLNHYLLKTALIQQNTPMSDRGERLVRLFTTEDIHQFWQCENVWWYICYGPSTLNGGMEPLTQRCLLRRIIEEADSVIALDTHGASLRYGHETCLLPLACLLGLNGYDYQTDDLAELEERGWWACLVFPMASNIQLVFYRADAHDDDVLVKVLLNENEATLPLPSDVAPYYHWRDVRQYYLDKLEKGESALSLERQRVHSHLSDHGQKSVGACR